MFNKDEHSRKKAVGIAGSIAILCALCLLVASESTTFEERSRKARGNGRFLKEADHTDAFSTQTQATQKKANRAYDGPEMIKGEDTQAYGDEVFDFVGYKQRVVCSEYRGIDHPNAKGCCPESCGRRYCGTADCAMGPGGPNACCEHTMQRAICSPTQMAPCILNTTHMGNHFQDQKCLKHDGVDSPDGTSCCPATCGEYCGASFCASFNPVGSDPKETSECCTQDYATQCKEGVMAPCRFDKPKLVYTASGYTVGASISDVQTMTERPALTGWPKKLISYSLSKSNPSAIPSWCDFSTTSGVLTCHLQASGYGHVPSDKLYFHVEATDGESSFTGQVFVPFANPPVTLSYTVPDSYKGFEGLIGGLNPDVTCVWSDKVEKCDPDYSIEPDVPTGITFDTKTGTITGQLANFPQAREIWYAVTAQAFGQMVSFEFSVPHKPAATTTLAPTPAPTPAPPGIQPPSFSYQLPSVFDSNQKVKILPVNNGGKVSSKYTVKPSLPEGFSLDEVTGEVKGTLGVIGYRDATYEITASNKAGPGTADIILPLPLEPPADLGYDGLPKEFTSKKELKLVAHYANHPTHYRMEPEVPPGFVFNSATGALHGSIPDMKHAKLVKYTLIAENAAGKATYDFKLPQETSHGLHYKQPKSFATAVMMPPMFNGPTPILYVVEPSLPPVMTLDNKTGVVHGVIKRPTKEVDEYTITGITRVGNVTAIIKLPRPQPAPFPWWIVALGVAIILLLICCLWPKKKDPEPSYTQLKAEPAPPPAPVKPIMSNREIQTAPEVKPPPPPEPKVDPGFPITFDTDEGERTVYAKRKPLGLVYSKEIPVKITEEPEGSHGKEIGVKVGWVMRNVNGRDLTGCKTFDEVRHIMYEEVSKLPGAVSLTFITSEDNNKRASLREKMVWITKKELGLTFSKTPPVSVTEVAAGQHGAELDIKTGWTLKAVDNKDCSTKTYDEVNTMLQAAMGNLQ